MSNGHFVFVSESILHHLTPAPRMQTSGTASSPPRVNSSTSDGNDPRLYPGQSPTRGPGARPTIPPQQQQQRQQPGQGPPNGHPGGEEPDTVGNQAEEHRPENTARWDRPPHLLPQGVYGKPSEEDKDGDDCRRGEGDVGGDARVGGSEANGYWRARWEGGIGGDVGEGPGRVENARSYDDSGRVIHELVHGGDEDEEDEMFGNMAPCWRLLERAQSYMTEVRYDKNKRWRRW